MLSPDRWAVPILSNSFKESSVVEMLSIASPYKLSNRIFIKVLKPQLEIGFDSKFRIFIWPHGCQCNRQSKLSWSPTPIRVRFYKEAMLRIVLTASQLHPPQKLISLILQLLTSHNRKRQAAWFHGQMYQQRALRVFICFNAQSPRYLAQNSALLKFSQYLSKTCLKSQKMGPTSIEVFLRSQRSQLNYWSFIVD